MNTHLKIRLTKAQIGRALSILELCPGLELDEQLKLSTLEGETDLFELATTLLNANEDDEGDIAKLGEQIEVRKGRIERAKARIEARKNALISLMDCAAETTLRLPEATVSLRTLKPRPKVIDAAQLPPAFTIEEIIRKPDREAIEAAVEQGATIPGVIITNGGASLTVRRK